MEAEASASPAARAATMSSGPGRVCVSVSLVVVLVLMAGCATGSNAGSAAGAQTRQPVGADTGAASPPPVIATTAPIPTPSPEPLPTAAPTPFPIETRTLLFSGDVLSHTPVIAQALAYGSPQWPYDYRPMFVDVAARIRQADLAICVLETPVSADNRGLAGYPTFNAPRELPDALVDAGYDGCSTASNHSMDRGPSGVRTTLDQMDRVALGHAGMARSADEANRPRLYDLGGVAVAHLSFTYGLNGFVLPADEPWLVDVTDVGEIAASAAAARAAGADVVVLSIQWGNEYQRSPSDEQLLLADQITANGAVDLVIGNHVHVVQPVETVNGVPVVFGLGNSLSNQSDNCCRRGTQDGVMIEVEIEGNRERGFVVSGLTFAPTWVDRSNYTVIDLIDALADPALDPATRALYEQSFARTEEAVNLLGADLRVARPSDGAFAD